MPSFRPDTFKIVQINAENLFLFIDDPVQGQLFAPDWRTMSERDWQRLSHATVPNKPLSKTLWMADSLLQMKPDIICVNEVGGVESLTNFNKYFLGDRYDVHLIEGNSDRGIDIGYLIRKDLGVRAELRSHKDRPLGFVYPHEEGRGLKSHGFSRDCAELRIFNDDSTRPALVILLVHLKSKLDPKNIDPNGRERRRAELNMLMTIYRETRAEFSPPVPVVVTGDFNGCAKRAQLSDEFAEITRTDLESLMDILARDGEEAATQVQFNRNGQINCLQIDYIFMSPELKAQMIPEKCEVFRWRSDLRVPLPLPKTLEQRTYLPSDHYPVVATFKNFLAPSRD